MKKILLPALLAVAAPFLGVAADLTVNENWAANADAAAWGSNWSLGAQQVDTFLPESLGGENAGKWSAEGAGNNGVGQEFSRSFRNNTAGIDINQTYYIQFAVQLQPGFNPTSGAFLFIDGSSAGRAAEVGYSTSLNSSSLEFFALDNGVIVELTDDGTASGDTMQAAWGTTYVFDITVHVTTRTYDAKITQLDSAGVAVGSVFANGLDGEQTAYNNNAHGVLTFHNSTQNNRSSTLDRITVSNAPISALVVPEPGAVVLAALGTTFLLWRSRRKS